VWSDWFPIAFDLTYYAKNHKAVRLKISASGCAQTAHGGEGLFAAWCGAGKIDVEACGTTAVALSVPGGFVPSEYHWYVGTNPQDKQEFFPSNKYQFTRVRNPNETYFRCEMLSQNGVPFVYEGYVTYFEIEPKFVYSQTNTNCTHQITFENTSQITIMNGGNNTPQPLNHVKWDFGDGSPASTAISPVHTYAAGTYDVTLVVWDNDEKCSDTIVQTITVTDFYPKVPGTVDLFTCEKNLPYTYTNDEGKQYPMTGATTIRDTLFGRTADGCDSIVIIKLAVENPVVTIRQDGDFCGDLSTELTAEVKDFASPEYLWNTKEISQTIHVEAPGEYSVTVTDTSGCSASHKISIPACKPMIILPNAITPSDETSSVNNCFFIPQTNLIKSIKMTIFNRWGNAVYTTVDKNFKWCGEKPNKRAGYNNTYTYLLYVTDYDGIETMYKGAITVL
jgi:PKD repeat protein